MAAGRCKAAYYTDEWHGYGCEITEGACMFLFPDSKACAEKYGEGPDMDKEETESRTIQMIDYIEGPVPKDLCTVDREGGADDFMGCGHCFDGGGEDGADCGNCIVNRIFKEYARLTGQAE